MVSALVTQIPKFQETFANEVIGELFLALIIQLLVERTLISEFCQELGCVAAHVSFDLSLAKPTTGQRSLSVIVLYVAEIIFLNHDLHRDSKFANVVEYRMVITRQTPRAVIEILALVEVTCPGRAVNFRRRGSRARGLAAAPGKRSCFQNLAVVTAQSQLVGSGHP